MTTQNSEQPKIINSEVLNAKTKLAQHANKIPNPILRDYVQRISDRLSNDALSAEGFHLQSALVLESLRQSVDPNTNEEIVSVAKDNKHVYFALLKLIPQIAIDIFGKQFGEEVINIQAGFLKSTQETTE